MTFGTVIAALVLLAVLIIGVLYYCKQHASGFTPGGYTPACGGTEWQGRNRKNCHGMTSGTMPVLEYRNPCMGDLGCGLLGIPP